MSKVDPNLIERQINVKHLEFLANDLNELQRCKEGEEHLMRAYNAEKTKLLSQFKKLNSDTQIRLSDLFKAVFMKDTDAAIIMGEQLFVRSFYDGYEKIDNVPYVNFDEVMEDVK